MLDIVPVAPLFTVTLNVTVAIPFAFSTLAGTVSSIPFANCSLVNILPFELASVTITFPSSAIVVFVGTVSFTTTLPSAEPVFVAVIVYVIVSPATTADVLSDDFTTFITEPWYVVSVVGVSLSFTNAVFVIFVSSSKSLTVTSNITVTLSFAGTFTVIPSFKFCSVYTLESF